MSIILNITKPILKQTDDWPTCSFFAVYDGHGGAHCADFLRDNLHQYVSERAVSHLADREAGLVSLGPCGRNRSWLR